MSFFDVPWFKDESADADVIIITLEIPDELFKRWYDFCNRFGVDPETNITYLIENHIDDILKQEGPDDAEALSAKARLEDANAESEVK